MKSRTTAPHRIAALRAAGVSSSAGIAEALQREGYRGWSQSTVKRHLRGQKGSRASVVRPAAPPPPRGAADVLAKLPEADRALVIDWAGDVAQEAVDAHGAAVLSRLRALGREQATLTPCPTCGLRGLP